jgi:hypothetical protein
LARASAAYHEQLTAKANADHLAVKNGRTYLRKHGIESFDIAQRYQLGVVIDPLPGDEGFKGMLCYPYLTRHGVKALKFRNLGEGGPKNLVPEGQSLRLYNTNAYFDAGDVIGVAEGEPDTIAASEVLGVPTVGIPGVEAWTKNKRIWAPLFKNFQRVLVFVQGDVLNPNTGLRPGEELGKNIAASLGWRVRLIKSPEGEDVSSMVAGGRADELIKQFGSDEDDE